MVAKPPVYTPYALFPTPVIVPELDNDVKESRYTPYAVPLVDVPVIVPEFVAVAELKSDTP
jgi:hypothetical protein